MSASVTAIERFTGALGAQVAAAVSTGTPLKLTRDDSNSGSTVNPIPTAAGSTNFSFEAVVGLGVTTAASPITSITNRRLSLGTVAISGVSVANPSVITATAHGFSNGDYVTISGTSTTPSINNTYQISNVTTNTFTIPVNVTAVTTGTGTAIRGPIGYQLYDKTASDATYVQGSQVAASGTQIGTAPTNYQLLTTSTQQYDNTAVNSNITATTTGAISAVSVANPTSITATAHGLGANGTIVQVYINGTSTTPSINGLQTATITSANAFTLPINVTAVTTGTGTFAAAPNGNYERALFGCDNTAVVTGLQNLPNLILTYDEQ